jgi:hypothetical protein
MENRTKKEMALFCVVVDVFVFVWRSEICVAPAKGVLFVYIVIFFFKVILCCFLLKIALV